MYSEYMRYSCSHQKRIAFVVSLVVVPEVEHRSFASLVPLQSPS